MSCRKYILACSIAMLCALCTCDVVFADSAAVGASRDNTLFEDAAGGLSNGAGDHFFAGSVSFGGSGLARRGLVMFDVASAIPAGSTIDSVTLRLNMSRTIAGDQNISIFPVLSDWGEGTSHAGGQEGAGASSTANDATWLHTYYDSSFWIAPGGDFLPIASATISVGGNGFYTWGSTAAMVSDVQSWLDTPAGNFGWMLQGNETNLTTAKRFDSRSHPNTAVRPLLTIEYTPIPSPASILPILLGAVCSRRRRGIR